MNHPATLTVVWGSQAAATVAARAGGCYCCNLLLCKHSCTTVPITTQLLQLTTQLLKLTTQVLPLSTQLLQCTTPVLQVLQQTRQSSRQPVKVGAVIIVSIDEAHHGV